MSKDRAINELQVTQLFEGEETVMLLAGQLNEFSQLPDLSEVRSTYVVLNMEKITRVNSIGIGKWIDWISSRSDLIFVYKKIPVQIVELFSHVEGLIPPASKIQSFFVPYIVTGGDLTKDILFVRDTHFDSSGVFPAARVKHPMTDEEMEMDVSPTRYFAFLKN